MLQNHAFFTYKNKGAAQCLRGKVLVELVFVSDDDSTWTQSEMDQFYVGCKEGLSCLCRQASQAGVPLRFSTLAGRYCYKGRLNPNTLNTKDLPLILSLYLAGQGFIQYEDYLKSRKSTYSMDEVAVMFVLEDRFRAFAMPNTDLEYCALTQTDNDHVVAHELLHLFGATDLYYPYQVYGLTMTYFPQTVMCTLEGMEVDELTQYLVGWTNTLSPRAREYMDKVSELTQERFSHANVLEFYRDRENCLLENASPYLRLDQVTMRVQQSDPFAEFLMGICYRDGIGVPQDPKKAEELFALSGRTGLTIAAYAHAQMLLFRSSLTPLDRENLWLILDYNSGNHLQLASLRQACLLTGVGGKTNLDWAVKNIVHQYQESEKFLPYAKRSAWFYRIAEKLCCNIPQLHSVIKAMRERYDQMLQSGDPDLLYLVAQLLEEGKYVEKDLSGAFTLYETAAHMDNYLACLALSRCYRNGIGTKQDLNAAKQWMKAAASCRTALPWDAFCRIMK